MALGFYFKPSSFTPALYDEAVSQLQIQVFDVWDSQEAFEAFGETLLPIMGALGADPGQPQVSTVHNIIKG